ncbi:MAG: hypothetical protein CL719_10330 [Chloroflexi bacterium]|nr:hypothetical protein [Chloroflexota bacterium]
MTDHVVTAHDSLKDTPRELDLAIVATTASVRPTATEQIANHADIQMWILEKVLAQNLAGLDDLLVSTADATGAWVNTPRRIIDWYRRIGEAGAAQSPVEIVVDGGGWGMACNAIHFLDLCAWWSGGRIDTVDTAGLSPEWLPARRPGNFEISGMMEVRFTSNSSVLLRDAGGSEPLTISVNSANHKWHIQESEGRAVRSDGRRDDGRLTLQSELTGGLVDSLLRSGGCGLPTLAEGVDLHRPFLSAMLDHWRAAGHPGAQSVPIT